MDGRDQSRGGLWREEWDQCRGCHASCARRRHRSKKCFEGGTSVETCFEKGASVEEWLEGTSAEGVGVQRFRDGLVFKAHRLL